MPKTVACKCPNCGAAISVPPVNGVTRCDYCQSAIQVKTDEEGGVSLSVKHIHVQGGNVQIADKLTVVQGDTAVTCFYCGRHNLKHHTFRCRRCEIDDICVDHQSSSGICESCLEEEIAEAKRLRAEQTTEENKRRLKMTMVVTAIVAVAVFFLCVVVPFLIFLLSAIYHTPTDVKVVFFFAALAIGFVTWAVWFAQKSLRGQKQETDEEE